MKTVRNLNSLTLIEIDKLCTTYNSACTERHQTQRNDFTYQSQYVSQVYRLIRWAIKAKEVQITFQSDLVNS